MEGEGEEAAEAAPSRWTCEACGCNTNLSTTDRCGICGTNNSGEIPFRRVKSAGLKEFQRDFPGVFPGERLWSEGKKGGEDSPETF